MITWSEFAILSHRHISFHPTERKVISSVRILRNNMTGSLHRRLCSSLPTHLVRVWHVLFLIMFNRRWTIGADGGTWTHTMFPSKDFESFTSAYSITSAYYPWPMPNFSSDTAHKPFNWSWDVYLKSCEIKEAHFHTPYSVGLIEVYNNTWNEIKRKKKQRELLSRCSL